MKKNHLGGTLFWHEGETLRSSMIDRRNRLYSRHNSVGVCLLSRLISAAKQLGLVALFSSFPARSRRSSLPRNLISPARLNERGTLITQRFSARRDLGEAINYTKNYSSDSRRHFFLLAKSLRSLNQYLERKITSRNWRRLHQREEQIEGA